MKNLSLIISSVLFLSLSMSNAQPKVVSLNRNGNSFVFTGDSAFVYAYNYAQNGDTIYLPGGIIIYPSKIDKRLVIYGTGHYPDSTTATGVSTFNGDLTIGENADKLHLEGIKINGNLNFEYGKKIDSVLIFRCYISGSVSGTGATGASEGKGNSFVQSIINGNLSLSGLPYSFVLNSYVYNIYYAKNSVISNNIIYLPDNSYYNYTFSNVVDCQITNNIIFQYYSYYMLTSSQNNVFSNNVFRFSQNNDPNNVYSDNYFSVDMTSNFFVNWGGYYNFNYTYNYHLQNPSNYLGNDGTEVGLYGGYMPYKDGALPTNPHIRFKQISSHSSATGKIGVHIKAGAQNE